MKKFKAFIDSLDTAYEATKLVVTGRLWSEIEQLESVDPEHIGVSQDQSLCRNCTLALTKPQDLEEYTDISRSLARLEASATLGCFLCSILYNADWTPLDSNRSDLSLTEKLWDMKPPPQLFSCNIHQTEEEAESGCYHIEATAGKVEDVERIWKFSNIMLIPEKEITHMTSPKLLPSNTADEVARQAILWIKQCQTTHSSCESVNLAASTTWKPTRLIFTGRPDLGLQPRLCLSQDLPLNITYVTLSHCWGLIKIFRLLSTNLDGLLKELPLSDLTQVFRDAIDLARRLGVSYIWIDSLCIMQDSVEDWEHESALMGNVYKYSWCNIAATGFENGLAGIYVKRNPSILSSIIVNLEVRVPDNGTGLKICKGRFYCIENYWNTDVTKGPLNQRAWVYQERLLAPRVLHLGSRQAFWECSETEACEVFPAGLPTPLRSLFKVRTSHLLFNARLASSSSEISPDKYSDADLFDSENEMLTLWWQVVKGYNRGGLTKHEDKLTAIAGVAQEMQTCLKDEYVAGLWKKHLLQHLVWFVVASEPDSDWQWGQKSRSKFYQAPSWSWASVNERVENLANFDSVPLATVLDYKVTLAANSEFGRVTGGYIRIRGHLTQATFCASDKKLRKNWAEDDVDKVVLRSGSSTKTLVLPTLIPDVRVGVPSPVDNGAPSYPVRDAIGSRDFYLLPMCENEGGWVGLLLQRARTGTRGLYQRLGAFLQLKEDEKSFLAFQSHIPKLDAQEYEEHDDYGYTISII